MNDFLSSIFEGLKGALQPAQPQADAAPDVQGILFRAGFGALWQDEYRFAETSEDLVRMGGPEVDFEKWSKPPQGQEQPAVTSVRYGPAPLAPAPVSSAPLPVLEVPSVNTAEVLRAPTEAPLPGTALEVPTPVPTDRPPNIPPNIPRVSVEGPTSITEAVFKTFTPAPKNRWADPMPNPLGKPLDNVPVRREALGSMKGTWTSRNETWKGLDDHQRAAAMALLEADGRRSEDAKNALAAMHNRAAKDRLKLGEHVSTRHYQPTFEPTQEKRLTRILASKEFKELVSWSQRYASGQEADPVNGATHFLAHPPVMLALEARNPRKYRSWRSWSGFDEKTRTYKNHNASDRSHAFLSPDGRFSLGGPK